MAKTTAPTDAAVTRAYHEALNRYGHRSCVTGIDTGFEYRDGKKTGKTVIRIHVREKIDKSALEEAELFPESIEGVPVDVLQKNYHPHDVRSREVALVRTTRYATLQPGISTAHKSVSAGTLGLIVKDNRSGGPAILSNWHVLVGSAKAQPGDDILQPGPYDGGRVPADVVARLDRMILDKDGDAALATLTGRRPYLPHLVDTNVLIGSVGPATLGAVVVKSGRTTGVTKGRVDGMGRYYITYSVGRVGVDGFVIAPLTPGNPDDLEISEGGDSGSIWYVEGTTQAVGLHFAGETDPRPGEEHGIACHAPRVFSRLDISPLTSGAGSEDVTSPQTLHALSAQLGAAVTAGTLDAVDGREIRRFASALTRSYPHLAEDADVSQRLRDASAPEIGPFGAVAIGFAAGAAARLLGRETASNGSSADAEAFPVVVAAFLAGAVAGARAVDGKL